MLMVTYPPDTVSVPLVAGLNVMVPAGETVMDPARTEFAPLLVRPYPLAVITVLAGKNPLGAVAT